MAFEHRGYFAKVLEEMGLVAEAEPLGREALAEAAQALGEEHPVSQSFRSLV